jgi:hypothetical protein
MSSSILVFLFGHFQCSPVQPCRSYALTLWMPTAGPQSTQRRRSFLVGANEDLITNHREMITNGRWRLYENWYVGVRSSLEVFMSANRRYH